jgi:hypothetical protein
MYIGYITDEHHLLGMHVGFLTAIKTREYAKTGTLKYTPKLIASAERAGDKLPGIM